jgi:hypothetical protein
MRYFSSWSEPPPARIPFDGDGEKSSKPIFTKMMPPAAQDQCPKNQKEEAQKEEIMERLEERVGPKGRKLLSSFCKR